VKVVYNACFGGFGLSQEAMDALGIDKEQAYSYATDYSLRSDQKLVEVVERLGARANSGYSELKIKEVPDGHEFFITEYDGSEGVLHSEPNPPDPEIAKKDEEIAQLRQVVDQLSRAKSNIEKDEEIAKLKKLVDEIVTERANQLTEKDYL
jgi:hypothetical protein